MTTVDPDIQLRFHRVSLSVNGKEVCVMTRVPTKVGSLVEKKKSCFLSTDEFLFQVETFFGSGSPYASWAGWDVWLSGKTPPEQFQWVACLSELDSTGKRMTVWTDTGIQPISATNTVSFRIPTLSAMLHTRGSRSAGPYLELICGCALLPLQSPLIPPRIGEPPGVGGIGIGALQTESDALRQEYINFQSSWIPSEDDIVDMVKPFNVGNYYTEGFTFPPELAKEREILVKLWGDKYLDGSGLGINSRLEEHYEKVLSSYRGRLVVEAPRLASLHLLNGLVGTPLIVEGSPVYLPNDSRTKIKIASAYRNPRRNVDVGSKYPVTSKHVLGRALDLVPLPVSGLLPDGSEVELDLHRHLFPTLLQAARSASHSSLGEDGAKPVPIGDHSEDHVHIQW